MRSMLGGRISYHGFRYAKLSKNAGDALLDESRARVQIKEFLSSGTLLNDCSADKLVACDPVSPAEASTLIYGVDDPCGPEATAASSSE